MILWWLERWWARPWKLLVSVHIYMNIYMWIWICLSIYLSRFESFIDSFFFLNDDFVITREMMIITMKATGKSVYLYMYIHVHNLYVHICGSLIGRSLHPMSLQSPKYTNTYICLYMYDFLQILRILLQRRLKNNWVRKKWIVYILLYVFMYW
jgi:hypothetical protein